MTSAMFISCFTLYLCHRALWLRGVWVKGTVGEKATCLLLVMWEGPQLPWPRAQLFFPTPNCRAEGPFLCSQGSGFSPQWPYGCRDIHHPEKLLIWKKKVFTRHLNILSKTNGKLVVTLRVPSADRQFCLRAFQVEKEQAVSRRIPVYGWLFLWAPHGKVTLSGTN